MEIGLHLCRVLRGHPQMRHYCASAREWLERCSMKLSQVAPEDEEGWIHWHKALQEVSRLYDLEHRPCAAASALMLGFNQEIGDAIFSFRVPLHQD